MKPPHANPAHPAHAYYCPDTDDYPESEAGIEHQWREHKGVNPRTGEAWLTPRMERNAVRLATQWADGAVAFPVLPNQQL